MGLGFGPAMPRGLHKRYSAAVLSSARNPVSPDQKMSPPRSRGFFFSCFVLVLLLVFIAHSCRADSLEDAARTLARKIAAVPQRESRLFLSWQNHSSIAEEHSEALKVSFTDELRGETLTEKQEAGTNVLQISIEETPAFYVLIASVPTAAGEATRMSRFARAALPSARISGVQHRLLKELIWEQPEPILDAVELAEDSNNPGSLLILNRDNLSLYQRENDLWELRDSKRLHAVEKAARAPRGEIRISVGTPKQDTIVLPDQICDLGVEGKIELNCRVGSQPWREGMSLGSTCDRGLWWLKAQSGDWSAPDRILLRDPSLPKSAPQGSELELPGPSLSISRGRHLVSNTAVVFNLSTGNYEVYRITLACAN